MKKIISVLVLMLAVFSCSKNEEDVASNNYDQTALLTNWADNIIVPSFVNYQNKTNLLVASSNAFDATPNETNLISLRNSWIEAYKAYQYVAMYNFGKAEEINFKEKTNFFPTNVTGINSNISSGAYNLNVISQIEMQGLPAIDYLINGLGTNDSEIIGFYTTNSNSVNYKKYLKDVVAKLKSNIDLIVTDWNSNYRNTYIKNTGTSVTAAVNVTTNNFVQNFEKDVRTAKIGIPSGKFSANVLRPNDVEAFYKNDISKMLLIESIKASQNFFNGKHFNSETVGVGLKTYLEFRDNQKLSDIINNQYTTILSTVNGLNNSLSFEVNNNNTKMLNAYDELQKNVVFTKLSMTQALTISIVYSDSDGD